MGGACSSEQNQDPLQPSNVEELKPEEPENVEPVQPYGDAEPVKPYGDAKPVQPYGDNRPYGGDYGGDAEPIQANPDDYGPAEAAGSVMDYEAYNKWIEGYNHTSGAAQYQSDGYSQQYSHDYGHQGGDYSNREYYY